MPKYSDILSETKIVVSSTDNNWTNLQCKYLPRGWRPISCLTQVFWRVSRLSASWSGYTCHSRPFARHLGTKTMIFTINFIRSYVTYCFSLSEDDVSNSVSLLCSDGVEEVKENGLSLSTGEEPFSFLNVDKVTTWQHQNSKFTRNVVNEPSAKVNSFLPPPSSSFKCLGICNSSNPLRNLSTRIIFSSN